MQATHQVLPHAGPRVARAAEHRQGHARALARLRLAARCEGRGVEELAHGPPQGGDRERQGQRQEVTQRVMRYAVCARGPLSRHRAMMWPRGPCRATGQRCGGDARRSFRCKSQKHTPFPRRRANAGKKPCRAAGPAETKIGRATPRCRCVSAIVLSCAQLHPNRARTLRIRLARFHAFLFA